MNKKLLKQIVNERRSNSWLFIELLLVSIVLWYVVDYMFVTLYTYFEPRGFDIENTYRVEFDYLTEKSPDYIANRTDEEAHADMRELLDRLRRRPGVEAVSMSQNSFPYNGKHGRSRASPNDGCCTCSPWYPGVRPSHCYFRCTGKNFVWIRTLPIYPNWWQRSKWSVMMIFPPVLIAGPQSSHLYAAGCGTRMFPIAPEKY